MRRFRIGVDARPLSTPMSGVGRLIHETIRSFPNQSQYEFVLFSHKPVHQHHKSLLVLSNTYWVQGEWLFSSKGGVYFTVELPFQIYKQGIDLFWGAQQVLPPGIRKTIPCVLGYMDMVLYLYPGTMRTLARWQQRAYQKYSVDRADYIVSISESTRKDVIKKFRYPLEKTSVAYPGIDPILVESYLTKKISPRIQSIPRPYILSVSTIEPRKNYRFLLEVFRLIRSSKSLPELHWVIAGRRGWEKPSFYRELDSDRERFRDIFVLEDLDDSELHYLYRNSSLFWMASLYEGFGIPVVEALYHRKMAILSDIQPFREIGKDSLEYLPASSREDMQKWKNLSIQYILSGKSYNGDITSFTWENSAKEYERIFQLLLSFNRNGSTG